jgi:uncharacterized Ntn-hydrolase superfamily protein
MTYSIIAFDKNSGTAGVATATGSVSIGAFVPHVLAGVGALTTQGAYTNWLYGEMGLDLLRQKHSSRSALQALVAKDEGRQYRQCLIIDQHGKGFGWTGEKNEDMKEIKFMEGVVAGGNLLANSKVVPALLEAFQSNANRPLVLRLLRALQAGEKAGGDSRGLVSAAIKVDFLSKPPVDIRVDYSPGDTLIKLEEVYTHYHTSPFREFYNGVPTRKNFSKCG